MKNLSFTLILLINLNIFGQSDLPRLNCEEFDYSINSNTRMNLKFLSLESYNETDKDTIQKDNVKTSENIELNKIFQKKYPNKITEHCINSNYYDRDSITNLKFCDEKTKIKLVDKKANFYIFKIDAFEVNNYLLFNADNEVIYTINNFPQILENGKIVIDAGFEYGGYNVINYYVFEEKEIKYFEFIVPMYYHLQNLKLLKSFNHKTKVIGDFIRYDYKEVPNKEGFGKKYVYDKDKYCRKLIMIF